MHQLNICHKRRKRTKKVYSFSVITKVENELLAGRKEIKSWLLILLIMTEEVKHIL
jgi:hypothetical protein